MSVDNAAEAAEHKSRGNDAFKAGDLDKAIDEFTAAIELDPENAVYYSNRSMVALKKGDLEAALKDGQKCVEMKPDWAKGYSRKAAALYHAGQLEEAAKVYEEGADKCGGDAGLKASLEQTRAEIERRSAQQQQQGGNPFAEMFGDQMWAKLMANPDTKPYLSEPDVVNKLKQIQGNPQLFAQYLSDPKIGRCIEVLLGMPGGMGGAGGAGGAGAQQQQQQQQPKPEPKKEPEPELTEEEKAEQAKRAEALAAKEAGNASFKARKFDEALEHYKRALDIDPTNGVFHNNIAAVYMMQKKYDEAIAESAKAREVGHPDPATSYSVAAKAWAREGTALQRLGRLEDALEALDKSMVEKADRKVDKQRREIRAEMKAKEEAAFLDPEKSEEHKAKGAELFKANDFPGALKEFDAALKRDPSNFRARSNRALTYTKLMQWAPALEDCETIIKQKPEFVKAYVRKGKIQVFLKQFDKAAETYQQGLAHEPNNPELIECLADLQRAVQNLSEEDKERRAQEALKNPEIQQLLRDPMVNQAIRDLQDPKASATVRNNPEMMGKIQRLIAAGVLRTN